MESEGASRRVGVIPVVIAAFGLLAAILSFCAEGSRVTDAYVDSCESVKYPASALGISAALIFLVTQVGATIWGGCVGGSYVAPSLENRKKKAIVAYLASSWVTFVVGFSLLIYGSSVNGRSKVEYNPYDGTYSYYCPVVDVGILGAGGALFLVSTGLLVAYMLATQVGLTSTDATIDQRQTELGSTQDFNHTGRKSQLGPGA